MNAITNHALMEAAQGAGEARGGASLLYEPGERCFANQAPMLLAMGWSVYPQERSGGREPGRVGGPGGKRIKWGTYRDRHPTPEEMKEFCRDCAQLNVAVPFGSASGGTFAFDVDCMDRPTSAKVQDVIEGILGATPLVRIGKEPKAALIYRTTDPIRNRSVLFQGMDECGMELLTSGKSLTFTGRHHSTGRYFQWPRENPFTSGPDAAPLVSAAQVEAVWAAVEAAFPFAKRPVPAGGEMSETDWDTSPSGYRKPRVSAPECGLATDGREGLLADLVYRAVAGNGHALLRANAEGGLDAVRSALCAVVRDAFVEVAAATGRWSGQALKREVEGKVGHAVGRLLRREIKAWVARPEEPELSDDDLAFDPPPADAAQEQGQLMASLEERASSPEAAQGARALIAAAAARAGEEPEPDAAPFQCLGHDGGRFFILGRGGQVRDFSATDLGSKGCLFELADPQHWADRYYAQRGGIDLSAAQADLIAACYEKGVYNPEGVRGRGVWMDCGRTVMHLGDMLLVDGVRVRPQDIRSRYTYEASRAFDLTVGEPPMCAEEAQGLLDLMRLFSWERPGMGALLAGWCALAPVCGALPWRPHAWVTAEPGTGKSWLLNNVVLPVVGSVGLSVQGGTTEAGIRQGLRQDARPVIFDESEGQTEGDRARIQKVLNLARQSSTGAGAEILLGTSDQKGASYSTKATFLFSSAQVGVQQAADQRRWLVLTLVASTDAGDRAASFERIQAARAALFGKADFGPRLLSRTLRLLPCILATTDLLVAALVRAGGDQATAWTVAVPLAGAWHLQTDASPTEGEADAFVMPYTSRGTTAVVERVPEWRQCLDYLLQQEVESLQSDGMRAKRSLGSLISSGATNALLQYGIKEQDGGYVFAANSATVAKLMRGSTWGPSWAETLARSPGAKRRGSVRYTPTLVASSAVCVPSGLVVEVPKPRQPREPRREPTAPEVAWQAKAAEMNGSHLTH